MIRLAMPEIGDEEILAVEKVLRSGYLVQGAHVGEFERQVSEYLGVKHAVAVSSGTAALHLAVLALGMGPGDEVLVPDFTHPATVNVVELAGARPILLDIDVRTFNVDIGKIKEALSPRTKAIIPVHLFGQPADMDPILALARDHRLMVIEDAACALGAEYRGRRVGTLSEVGCFSFHPRKVITTGEGGMVVTNDEALAGLVRTLRDHGMVSAGGRNRFEMAGFNYRMTDFQGAMGVVQMRRIESLIKRRMELAALYAEALGAIDGVVTPSMLDGVRSTWQSYVVLLPERVDRDTVRARLLEDGIETTIGTYAVSAQPHHKGPDHPLRNSLRAYERSLCLPLHPRMSVDDVRVVADCLMKILG